LDGNSSFLRLSQDSMPSLSTFHNHRRSISAGEVLEIDPAEPTASGWTDPTSSYRGSVAYSSLPSTSSQEFPPTPTFDLEMDKSGRRTITNMKHFSTIPTTYRGHTRLKTGSGEVIVLDGLDDGSSGHFKLDEMPIWVFNSWPDAPGVSVVH
jgi:hypothetical protein